MKVTLDSTTINPFTTEKGRAALHAKFAAPLVKMLCRHSVSVADAEDAVAEAFHKLMHKKGPSVWGDRMPKT